MMWLGYLVGRLFGWTVYEALFAGAALSHLQHHHHRQGVRRAEDQGASGRDRVRRPHRRGSDRDPAADDPDGGRVGRRAVGHRAGAQHRQAGRLPGRPAGRGDAGRPAPDARRGAPAQQRDHGGRGGGRLSFAFALLARWMGYSVALGAFLAGALVAESGAAKIIEHRIEPVRDVFAAVFFVSVGMLIDPLLVWQNLARRAGADGGRGGGQPDRRRRSGRSSPATASARRCRRR